MRTTLLFFILTTTLFGFEVNTHQAMMRCAITLECGTEGSENLNSFVNKALLKNVDYSNEEFEKYSDTYLHYATIGEGLVAWNIDFLSSDYLAMLEAGVVLEDAIYPDSAVAGDGRYNNHFYAVQFNSQEGCTQKSLMKTNHALCLGYGQRTDNIAWGLDDTTVLGNNRKNDYALQDAFNYFRNAFEGSLTSRRRAQAKLFVTLGFLSHLIQDLHSPAHVRDGSHPFGDDLEVYGRYDGGFNLKFGLLNENNNPAIVEAVKEYDMKKWMLQQNSYSSYQDMFYHEASWISNNFFSESSTADRIFDDYNTHLSREETYNEAINGSSKWFYINTNENVAVEKGDINRTRVALFEDGLLTNSDHMVAVVEGSEDTTALQETSINVMPRSIASTQAFLNYFFRASMDVKLEEDKLTITNISDETLVASKELLTFKKGAKISLLYVDADNVSREFFTTTLIKDVAVGEEYVIEGIEYSNLEFSLENQIVVLLDGQIGEERGLDDYALQARGLSVAYARAKITHADILLSLDRSGSMQKYIEQVKRSITELIDNTMQTEANSYVAISTFSSRATIVSGYTNKMQKSIEALEKIQTAGETALYDALILASQEAKKQKNTTSRKSILILYTDGVEQGSISSKEEAIDAISKANSSEIDAVYLIYLGENREASSALENIAALAGREFLKVDEASKLQNLLRDILLQE